MNTFFLRPIETADNPAIASIIRTVMTEFGAVGSGFSIEDPEVDSIAETYQNPRARYLVLVDNNQVLGGAGIQQLKGGDAQTCELQKMYFLPQARGKGFGEKIVHTLLEEAKSMGFSRCYLETIDRMYQAKGLYEKLGFKKLSAPMGSTGHCSCDGWYVKNL